MAEEEKQKSPVRKRKKNYLNNKDLFEQVVRSKEAGIMSDELAKMLQTLTERYGRSGRYIGYTYNDDMQAYAMMMLCRTWSKFKHEQYTNAFAYYTQCVTNSFNQFLNKEQAQRDIRDELLLKHGLSPSFNYIERHNTDSHYIDDEEDHGQKLQDLVTLDKFVDPETK